MALNYSSVTKVIDDKINRTSLPNECKYLLGERNGGARLINLFKILVTDALSKEDINSSNNAIVNLNNLYKIVYYDVSVLDKLIGSDQYREWFKGEDGSDGDTPEWNTNIGNYFAELISKCNTVGGMTPNTQFRWVIGGLLGLKPDKFSNSSITNINIYPQHDVTFNTVTGKLYYE
jgi:hypothetical protein